MTDSITPAAASDPTIFERIEQLTAQTSTDDLERLLRSIAHLEPIQQNSHLDAIHERVGIGKSLLNKQLRVYIKAIKQEKQSHDRELKADAATNAFAGFAKQIIVPINADGLHKKESELVLISKQDGQPAYITEFWNNQKRISAPGERQLSQALKAEGAKSGLKLLIGGDSEAALSPTLNQLKKDVEIALEQGAIGIPCRVTFGPYLDKEKGKLHTITNTDEGMLVLNQRHSVETAPQPAEDPTIIEDAKAILGDNVAIIVSHVIAAVTNEDPFSKHVLCIVGSSGAGKSTVARWIAGLIGDNNPTVVSGSSLDGSWPIVFGTRSPIIDNLDRSPLTPTALDILAGALTADTYNVPARYTPAGLSASLGYPIMTSIHEATIDHYLPLKARAVIIRQSTSLEIMELSKSGAAKVILGRLLPHTWWLIERYIKDLNWGKMPVCPGGIRNTVARPYWWFCVNELKMTHEQAEIECEQLKISEESQDPDEQNAFVSCFDRAMIAEFNTLREETITFRATKVAEAMKQHCLSDELNDIFVTKASKFTEYKQIGKAVRRLIENHRTQNRIGQWLIMDQYDKKSKSAVFIISRAEAGERVINLHADDMHRPATPASQHVAGERVTFTPSYGIGPENNLFSQPNSKNDSLAHEGRLEKSPAHPPISADPLSGSLTAAVHMAVHTISMHRSPASIDPVEFEHEPSEADMDKARAKEARKRREDM